MAFLFAAIEIFLWYLDMMCRQLAANLTLILSVRIRAGLSTLVYSKITQLTTYSLKNADIGKIISLLVTDLGTIEERLADVIQCLSFPILLIGVISIMAVRVGWVGIICILVNILMILLSKKIS